jgi:AcrR family transcriptional regulator
MARDTPDSRDSDPSRRPGRPQDSALDDAIVRAALEMLAEVGYERLSIEEVARRAGTAKTSVYRRWPTKEALTLEAVRRYLATIAGTLRGAPHANTLRADLIAHIGQLTTVLTRERIGVLAGLLLAIRTNRELAAMIRAELVQAEVTAMRAILERAAARREIAAADRSALIFHLVPGVLFTRLFVLDQPMESAFAAQIVDDLLLPLLAKDGPKRRAPVRKGQSSRKL